MSEEIKKEVRNWWAENPMTYGSEHGRTSFGLDEDNEMQFELGTREFFERSDKTFFEWNASLHTSEGFFSKIFPYADYYNKKVLEVGCGLGAMAMQWALANANITVVDLNPVAVAQTRRRFEIFGLEGVFQEVDGNVLPFEDEVFDYVYSWGVLHHSPDLARSMSELFRVIRPGGIGVLEFRREGVASAHTVGRPWVAKDSMADVTDGVPPPRHSAGRDSR